MRVSAKCREIVQKMHFGRFVVYAAAVVCQTITDDHVGRPVDVVVAGNLVENGLRQGYVRSFALNN